MFYLYNYSFTQKRRQNDIANYRAIRPMSNLYKIFSEIINNTLKKSWTRTNTENKQGSEKIRKYSATYRPLNKLLRSVMDLKNFTISITSIIIIRHSTGLNVYIYGKHFRTKEYQINRYRRVISQV